MLWLDILPAVSAVITVAGLSFKAGKIVQKLDHVVEEVHDLKSDIGILKDDVRKIKDEQRDHDKRIAIIESTMVKMDDLLGR